MNLADAVVRQSGLTPIERELAILFVGAVTEIPFVLHAHRQIAAQSGLSGDQINAISSGDMPEGLTVEERTVTSVAFILAASGNVLDDVAWAAAKEKLGEERCARIAHLVGVYLYMGTLLRIGDVSPAGGDRAPLIDSSEPNGGQASNAGEFTDFSDTSNAKVGTERCEISTDLTDPPAAKVNDGGEETLHCNGGN